MSYVRDLRWFLEEQQKSLDKEQALKLIYILKAWRVLTQENKIIQDDLLFPSIFDEDIDGNHFSKICAKLAKEHRIFKLFLNENIPFKKLQQEDMNLFVRQSRPFMSNLTVYEAFFSILKRYKEYNISNDVAKLGIGLLNDNCESIYSPFSTSLNLCYYTEEKVFAESLLDQFIVELMKVVDRVDLDFRHMDVLDTPSYLDPLDKGLLQQFECVLSFPPMGLPVNSKLFNSDSFSRFNIHKGKGNRDVAHIEHILAQTSGKAVVLVPLGMCYRIGVELELRKYLIENNLLESIIQLPSNLNNATSTESTFFVINKHKQNDKVHFINLKDEQFLAKEGRKTVLNNLDKILAIFNQKKEEENISKLVSNQNIVENGYALNIERYVISKKASEILKQMNKYEFVELQSIAEVRKSQLFQDEEDGSIDIIELGPSNIAKAGYTLADDGNIKYIYKQRKKLETYQLETRDIVLSTKGTIGKVGLLLPNLTPAVASQAMHIIRVKEVPGSSDHYLADQQFSLYMYLKSELGQTLLKQLVAGDVMPQISTSDLKKLKIPVLSDEKIEQIRDNFSTEQGLYKEIEQTMEKIKQIHSDF